MRVSIVTAVCGAQEITRRWFAETIAHASAEAEIIVVSNGSTPAEVEELKSLPAAQERRAVFLEFPEPLGSSRAFNLGLQAATGDVVAMLHNDLMVHMPGWDVALGNFFSNRGRVGIVGFAGAKRLGRDDIYRSPYELVQLARGDVYTSLTDWRNHGSECQTPIPVAVLDGLAIIGHRYILNELDGFDEDLGPHHMYDIDLSLRALSMGLTNYVVPVSCTHVSGQTANADRYQAKFGPDGEVHRIAHERFYSKWIGRLPVVIP